MPHRPAETPPRGKRTAGGMQVVRNAAEAAEFLARSGRFSNEERVFRFERMILLDSDAHSRGLEIADFIERAL